jgi:BirA family transcriptional regulator, biotin operon repressor / biotin---[acetyl-CoA-carboxylase] ligase
MDATDFPLTAKLDCDLTVLPSASSTNDYAIEHPGNPDRLGVVVTNNQTSGRGRAGRTWQQPAGSGLALSFTLPISSAIRAILPGVVPLVAGYLVSDAISRFGVAQVGVKWPNDVLVGGKKIAGVLTEKTSDHRTIVGIGINVEYPEIALPTPHSTSLHLHAPVDHNTPDALLSTVVEGFLRLARNGLDEGMWQSVTDRMVTIGRRIRVDFPGNDQRFGTARGVESDGSLRVLWDDGEAGVVIAGDVWHVFDAEHDEPR